MQSQLDYVGDDALVHAAVDRLHRAARTLIGDLRRIGRADFKPKLSANLRKLKDKLVAAYQEAGFQPPEPASFADQAGGNAANLKDLFDVCVAEGYLAKVTDDIYLHADAEAEMRRGVTERLAKGSGLTVAEIRDLLGTTRKYAVPLCEYLDRVGVTRREGDLRVPGRLAGEPAIRSTGRPDHDGQPLSPTARRQRRARRRGAARDAARSIRTSSSSPPCATSWTDCAARSARASRRWRRRRRRPSPARSARLERATRPKLVPVINATGIVLHTNLGRAPMAAEAARRGARGGGGLPQPRAGPGHRQALVAAGRRSASGCAG